MRPVPYLAQTTPGGCGACAFIMVAQFFDLAMNLTEDEALEGFGVDGAGPRCFDLSISFFKATVAFGLVAKVTASSRDTLRTHLATGPVVLFHKAFEAPDALPHFSVAIAASDRGITRHDPGAGAGVVDLWEDFEPLWDAAKVSWGPYDGCYTAVIRPKAWAVP